MAGKEHTIFKSYLYLTREEENDWRKEIVESMNEYIDEDEEPITDEEDYSVTERLYDYINMTYDDEKLNLNKTLPNNIIAIADAGRWDGRHRGYKVLGNNLNEVLYMGRDHQEINCYYDRYNVHSELVHHDATDRVVYRMIKEGVDIDTIEERLQEGKDINRYTVSLVPYIKEIYR